MLPRLEPLDYGTPQPRSRRFANNLILLAWMAAFIASTVCAAMTLGHLKEHHYTPQFSRYLAAYTVQAATRPALPRQPFVGQPYLPTQVWQYPTTYGALLCPAVFIAMVIHDFRSRRSGRAG